MNWIWTAFCSMPETPRGEYDEEIDVMADTHMKAKKMVEEILPVRYDYGLKIRKIVRKAPVITGFSNI